jgi:hypothetical protein
MEIALGRYVFEGPKSTKHVGRSAGVYAVLRHRGSDVDLLEIGESRDLRTTLQAHKRLAVWQNDHRAIVTIFVHYMPAVLHARRREIVREILDELEPDLVA